MTKNRAQITVRDFLPVAGVGEEALNQLAKPEPANRLQLLAEQSASWRDLQQIRPDGTERKCSLRKGEKKP